MGFWHSCFMDIWKLVAWFMDKIWVDKKHKIPWGKKTTKKKKDTKITVIVALPPDDSLSTEEIVL